MSLFISLPAKGFQHL